MIVANFVAAAIGLMLNPIYLPGYIVVGVKTRTCRNAIIYGIAWFLVCRTWLVWLYAGRLEHVGTETADFWLMAGIWSAAMGSLAVWSIASVIRHYLAVRNRRRSALGKG